MVLIRHLRSLVVCGSVVLLLSTWLFAQSNETVAADSIMNAWSIPLLRNTFLLALYVSLLAMPIGLPLAFLISRTNLIGRKTIEIVLYGLLFVPAYLQVAAWDAGFGLQGWVTQQLGNGTVLLEGWRGAVWVYVATLLPWIALINAAFFRLVPAELEDQARIDATGWQVFRTVTLRLALPGCIVSLLWIFIQVSNEVAITDVYQIRTYAEEVYTGFALGDSLDEVQLRVLPGVGLVCLLAVASYYLIAQVSFERSGIHGRNRTTFHLGKWRIALSIIVMFGFAVVVLVPILNLCWKAGIDVQSVDGQRVRTWKITKLFNMIADSPFEFSHEIAWSILLGQLASLTALTVSFLILWRIERRWNQFIAMILLLIGLAVPGPILALTAIRLLNLPFVPVYFYNDSIVGVWFVLTMRTLPITFFLVYAAIKSLDRHILESARIDGASWWQQILRISVPMISVQLIGVWLVSFVWAMAELSGSVLITPPGIDLISKSIFDLVHYGVEDRLAGFCLFSFAGFVMIAGIGMWLSRTSNTVDADFRN